MRSPPLLKTSASDNATGSQIFIKLNRDLCGRRVISRFSDLGKNFSGWEAQARRDPAG
ncbi:MAG: hypothetical protein NVS1B6_01610 [Steroidobacteraceae bacterium]